MGLMRYDYVTLINGLGGEATELAAVDTAPAVQDDANPGVRYGMGTRSVPVTDGEPPSGRRC